MPGIYTTSRIYKVLPQTLLHLRILRGQKYQLLHFKGWERRPGVEKRQLQGHALGTQDSNLSHLILFCHLSPLEVSTKKTPVVGNRRR